jgi:hypothetical protein
VTRGIWRPKKGNKMEKIIQRRFIPLHGGDNIKEEVMERKCDTQRGENVYEMLVGKAEGMRELGSPKNRWTADTGTYVEERRC